MFVAFGDSAASFCSLHVGFNVRRLQLLRTDIFNKLFYVTFVTVELTSLN